MEENRTALQDGFGYLPTANLSECLNSSFWARQGGKRAYLEPEKVCLVEAASALTDMACARGMDVGLWKGGSARDATLKGRESLRREAEGSLGLKYPPGNLSQDDLMAMIAAVGVGLPPTMGPATVQTTRKTSGKNPEVRDGSTHRHDQVAMNLRLGVEKELAKKQTERWAEIQEGGKRTSGVVKEVGGLGFSEEELIRQKTLWEAFKGKDAQSVPVEAGSLGLSEEEVRMQQEALIRFAKQAGEETGPVGKKRKRSESGGERRESDTHTGGKEGFEVELTVNEEVWEW